MILVIDNYDSFVHNLARYVGLAGWNCKVVRNDAVTLEQIAKMSPLGIVISPGPCTPKEAGISVDLVRNFGPTTPILGVCLGHQCIGEAYGGQTMRADKPMHGMSSMISHAGAGLYDRLPNPFEAGRYHSLISELPEECELIPNAWEGTGVEALSVSGDIMGFEHRTHPVYGVQFHPESVLTEHGQQLIDNFSALTQSWHEKQKDGDRNVA